MIAVGLGCAWLIAANVLALLQVGTITGCVPMGLSRLACRYWGILRIRTGRFWAWCF